jgi:hypothetical protein
MSLHAAHSTPPAAPPTTPTACTLSESPVPQHRGRGVTPLVRTAAPTPLSPAPPRGPNRLGDNRRRTQRQLLRCPRSSRTFAGSLRRRISSRWRSFHGRRGPRRVTKPCNRSPSTAMTCSRSSGRATRRRTRAPSRRCPYFLHLARCGTCACLTPPRAAHLAGTRWSQVCGALLSPGDPLASDRSGAPGSTGRAPSVPARDTNSRLIRRAAAPSGRHTPPRSCRGDQCADWAWRLPRGWQRSALPPT